MRHGTFSIENAQYLIQRFIYQQRLWTLWFMACLFCLNILFYILVRLCKREWLIVVISVLLPIVGLYYYEHGGTPLYWNVDVCMMAIPFFALGYLYKMHNERVDDFIQTKLKAIILFLWFAVVNIICWRLSLDGTGLGLEMFESNYGNPVFTYVSAFAGIFCVVIFSKWFTIEPIRYVGENSMLYYAWHQTIMIPIMSKLMGVIGSEQLMCYGLKGIFIYKMLMMLGILVVLTVCNWGINRLKLGFVIGKGIRYN